MKYSYSTNGLPVIIIIKQVIAGDDRLRPVSGYKKKIMGYTFFSHLRKKQDKSK